MFLLTLVGATLISTQGRLGAGEVTLKGTIVKAPEDKLKEGYMEGYTIIIKMVDDRTKKAKEEAIRISGSATDILKGKQGLSVKALKVGQKVTVVLYDEKDPKKTARNISIDE